MGMLFCWMSGGSCVLVCHVTLRSNYVSVWRWQLVSNDSKWQINSCLRDLDIQIILCLLGKTANLQSLSHSSKARVFGCSPFLAPKKQIFILLIEYQRFTARTLKQKTSVILYSRSKHLSWPDSQQLISSTPLGATALIKLWSSS